MKTMHRTLVIQARVGSKRLPGKMLTSLQGKPIAEWVAIRCKKALSINRWVAAIPSGEQNDPLAAEFESFGYEIFRGSENNVLERLYKAFNSQASDLFIRVCADNPLVSWEAIDQLTHFFNDFKMDYAYNHIPKNNEWPDGLGAEICSASTLEKIYKKATKDSQREHCFNYLWENENEFRISTFSPPISWRHPTLKFDVDTLTDLEFMKKYPWNVDSDINEIMSLLEKQ